MPCSSFDKPARKPTSPCAQWQALFCRAAGNFCELAQVHQLVLASYYSTSQCFFLPTFPSYWNLLFSFSLSCKTHHSSQSPGYLQSVIRPACLRYLNIFFGSGLFCCVMEKEVCWVNCLSISSRWGDGKTIFGEMAKAVGYIKVPQTLPAVCPPQTKNQKLRKRNLHKESF